MPHLVSEPVEASTWDSDCALHQRFFNEVHRVLAPGGRIYLGQAVFGPLDRIQVFATQVSFNIRRLSRKHLETEPSRTYYAFQLTLGRVPTRRGLAWLTNVSQVDTPTERR
jgi:hypothetical protein